MIKKMAFVLMVTLATYPATSKAEGGISAEQIYKYCSSDMGQGLCLSFYTGAANMAGYVGKLFCPPGRTIMHQIMSVSVDYLKAHQDKRREPAIKLFMEAMEKAYPCDK